MKCRNCENEVKKGNKFCSKSCSASFNNKRRRHSIETKRKISKSLGGAGIAKEERVCSKCGKTGIDGTNLCSECYLPEPPSQQTIEASMKAFHFYEQDLETELKNKYGNLHKEIINGIAYDFCNKNFIIEFTFDYGRGASEAIKRFESLPKTEKRTKIIYIPDKYVGEQRRKRLYVIGVIIKSSDKYRKKYLEK